MDECYKETCLEDSNCGGVVHSGELVEREPDTSSNKKRGILPVSMLGEVRGTCTLHGGAGDELGRGDYESVRRDGGTAKVKNIESGFIAYEGVNNNIAEFLQRVHGSDTSDERDWDLPRME